jgi:hypothetical protein
VLIATADEVIESPVECLFWDKADMTIALNDASFRG